MAVPAAAAHPTLKPRARVCLTAAAAAALLLLAAGVPTAADQRERITLRGHVQSLHIYGAPGGAPAVLSSGDGGWIHLAPHAAEVLAAHGWYVVGVDSRAYLESFTSAGASLRAADVPLDFKVLSDFASNGSGRRAVLVGVSEGAGLSVLAAAREPSKAAVAGVVALGLPDITELGWRWRDALIYVTHGVPKEPTFSTSAFVSAVSPLPLAAIHSSHDEFVPAAEIERVMSAARQPKKLWIVDASDHGFSDNLAGFDQRLIEAMTWVSAQGAH
jgi:fermentation-respiration switch protein FrsA (DUF1100 family)